MGAHTSAPLVRRLRGGVLDLADPALTEFLGAVLERGVNFRFVARGCSMDPFIKDGDLITIAPFAGRVVRVGHVIAFRNPVGRLTVHRVVRLVAGTKDAPVVVETRGDNRPQADGRVAAEDVLGVVTCVERGGRRLRLGVGREGALLSGLSRRGALQPVLRYARAMVGSGADLALPSPSEALNLETQAVLFCAQTALGTRGASGFRAAVAACPSGELLCREAVRQGMLGHLHRLVHEQDDTSFAEFALDRLDELYRQSAMRGLAQTASLLRLLGLLQARGVVAMPIKGPTWAERLYGDVSLRHWDDLDLLVSHAEVPLAREALLEAGFRDWTPLNSMIMRRRRAEGELAFICSTDNDLWVDLHWEIGVGPGARGLSAHHLIARAEAGELLGREILAPTQTDVLLMTCVQGTRDGWNSVEALLALAMQLHTMPPASWPEVMAAARAAGCARLVLVGVAHACRVLGMMQPPLISGLLAGDPAARRLLASLAPDSLARVAARGRAQQLAKLRSRIESSDSLAAAVAQAAVRVVRPSPDDWRFVSLPARLEWLYWLIRPVRLALKWARRR